MNDFCNRPITTLPLRDLPIDTLDSMVDYILTERDVQDVETGNTLATITRTPAAKLFPNGNYDNVTTLEPNNTSLVIPDKQVRAGYVSNSGNVISVGYANSSHRAMFLMIGKLADLLLIQSTGFVNIIEGHNYIPGVQYYLGNNGEPVADNTITGQKLFIPLSDTKLMINM